MAFGVHILEGEGDAFFTEKVLKERPNAEALKTTART
jgi:hypothetical protein